MDYRDYMSEAPPILQQFLSYHENIRGHGDKTVIEYYYDLRTFLRYLKIRRGIVPWRTPFEDISIADIDLDFLKKVDLNEIYDYLAYLAHDRVKNSRAHYTENGLEVSTRARKLATLRSFFKYLTSKAHLLEVNPLQDVDSPRLPKTLPRYLTLEESQKLLQSVDGAHRERDYCILVLFLNCGLRISELVGLDIGDIRKDHMRVLGKGNKERTVYLNDAAAAAINDYMAVRNLEEDSSLKAFFLSNRKQRMSRSTVHSMVKKTLEKAGLDSRLYSAHKLRHTAATLMLSNGVDVRTLQEVLGHDHLNTTQIYTHVSDSSLKEAANANPLANFKVAPPAAPKPEPAPDTPDLAPESKPEPAPDTIDSPPASEPEPAPDASDPAPESTDT